ncbi:aldolase/citrate lyase family protein [Cupriavidus pauculus]|uniref:aldolase/citrate lyase family protein n=1 Tax=Cupriavidus pauculus TaxID=82633 RepID=UPI001EE16EB8|nr:aldolase/citrate lyase family protein [Cupriavidus pauculus]
MPALVRVPDAASGWIGWALDAGAQGIVVPRIEDEEGAQQVARAAYYAPRGQAASASRGVRRTARNCG